MKLDFVQPEVVLPEDTFQPTMSSVHVEYANLKNSCLELKKSCPRMDKVEITLRLELNQAICPQL